MAEKRKEKEIGERLTDVMARAFPMQRDFTEAYEESFPVIQEKLIDLAELSAGQSLSVENLAILSNDLQLIVKTFQSLAEKASQAVTEANVAAMKLREFENDPAEVTEMLVDTATILINAAVWMQSSSEFVGQTIEMALPRTRQEAIGGLSNKMLKTWHDELLAEYKKRNV